MKSRWKLTSRGYNEEGSAGVKKESDSGISTALSSTCHLCRPAVSQAAVKGVIFLYGQRSLLCKVTAITGGAREIGEADVRLFAAKGVNVVIADIQDTVDNVWEEMYMAATMALTVDNYGRIDIMLCNPISRDCQELEPFIGEQLASLLYLEPDSELTMENVDFSMESVVCNPSTESGSCVKVDVAPPPPTACSAGTGHPGFVGVSAVEPRGPVHAEPPAGSGGAEKMSAVGCRRACCLLNPDTPILPTAQRDLTLPRYLFQPHHVYRLSNFFSHAERRPSSIIFLQHPTQKIKKLIEVPKVDDESTGDSGDQEGSGIEVQTEDQTVASPNTTLVDDAQIEGVPLPEKDQSV
ncbi:Zinc finger CCCH domain-containing protein 45 [Platanthera guangdongensis]|uniref:Zinc finger CCCH domain-containing protein 45 n=1 Tax=Platanthera guangdongensis TaxID=2320717 RepID=A0ABR2LD37_9ASPA